jgi:ATP-binding cassette subfamily B protein
MKSIWRPNMPQTTNPLRFFLFVSRPHARAAFFACLCVVSAAILGSVGVYLYKVITDAGLAFASGGSYLPLVYAVGAYFGVSLLSHFFWRGSGFIGMFWASGARATARDTLVSYLTDHSYSYFSNRFAGSLLSKVKQGADGIRDLVEGVLWQLLSFVVSLISAFVLVFGTNVIIGLILLGLLLVIVPFNWYLAQKRIPLSIAAQDAETELNGATVDSISNITSVHEYANRTYELDRLKGYILKRRLLGLRNWRFGEWMLFWNGVIINVFMAGMVFTAIYLATLGLLTPGDIILVLAMAWLLEERFIFLGSQFNHFSEVWGQLSESLKDIVVAQDVRDVSGAMPLVLSHSGLAFEDVSFKYEGTTVFEHLSLSIPEGQKVGLIGRSGAGKTTLVKLILRHYDLAEGRIVVGGTDIATITKESLRSHIAVVPQEPALFHRSIHDNIAYARPNASREEVIEAAKLAQAHDFIQEVPGGYEALVGERGVKLSGGQRQRIAIARALLKDAPVLLLDEATSALDSESEVLVQKALLKLMEGRTVIAIAHRLSTLRAMDRLIVFDAGKIIEDGTHDELLSKGGVYAELWNHQAGGFLED